MTHHVPESQDDVFDTKREYDKRPAEHVLDTQKIDACLDVLTRHAAVNTKSLSSEAAQAYRSMNAWAHYAQNDPTTYAQLYDMIQARFPDDRYSLGSVGAYYTGCRETSEGCACDGNCPGALPQPGVRSCDLNIVHMRRNRAVERDDSSQSNVYEFTHVPTPASHKAVLYALDTFQSIPEHVAKTFTQKGITHLRVIREKDPIPRDLHADDGFEPLESFVYRPKTPMYTARQVDAVEAPVATPPPRLYAPQPTYPSMPEPVQRHDVSPKEENRSRGDEKHERVICFSRSKFFFFVLVFLVLIGIAFYLLFKKNKETSVFGSYTTNPSFYTFS